MGAILRLDGRVEIEDQECDAAGVVTRTWGDPDPKAGATGRVWAIAVHRKPELRLKRWERGKLARAGASDVVIGDGGTLDYFDLAPGWYEADSATTPVRGLGACVVFRVGKSPRSIELVTRAGSTDEGRDLVIARLSGWSIDRLRAERDAYAADLAARSAAAGLPALRGTPGSVVWADEFRRTKIRHAREYVAGRYREWKCLPDGAERRRVGVAVGWLRAAVRHLRAEADAGWWVSRVSVSGTELVRGLAVAGHRGEVELVPDEGRGVA